MVVSEKRLCHSLGIVFFISVSPKKGEKRGYFSPLLSGRSIQEIADYVDVNCSPEIKALSDIFCTSSNALKIANSVAKETPIIFAPDKNLGKYIMEKVAITKTYHLQML
ncbi:quinolinate synthase NadA [Flavobacterium sp.]|uniref:quinolinate synthase NadA n=1 Tax=Flavobacterium sp. TaxID=239 RepID=UPI0040480F23